MTEDEKRIIDDNREKIFHLIWANTSATGEEAARAAKLMYPYPENKTVVVDNIEMCYDQETEKYKYNFKDIWFDDPPHIRPTPENIRRLYSLLQPDSRILD